MRSARAATREFEELASKAAACQLCPRMFGRMRVLSPANGLLSARLLFIAEAPGRLGADKSAVPLSGDQSGRNFERFLTGAGMVRDDCFITNAVLCNPRDQSGRNRKPAIDELARCRPFLEATIRLVNPLLVVTLGSVALEAARALVSHDLRLKRDVAALSQWDGRHLMPLYHPGPRALIHRPAPLQADDYRSVARALHALIAESHSVVARSSNSTSRRETPGSTWA